MIFAVLSFFLSLLSNRKRPLSIHCQCQTQLLTPHSHGVLSQFWFGSQKNICTRPVDSCWLEMSKNYFLIFCFCLCHAVGLVAFLLSHFWGKVNKTLSQSHQGPALFPNSCFTLVSGVTDNVFFFPNTNCIWRNTDLKCYKCDCCYSTCAVHLGPDLLPPFKISRHASVDTILRSQSDYK